MEFLNFINGQFVKANSEVAMEKFDPFTGKSIGSALSSTVIDLVGALQGAKNALGEMEKIHLEKRAEKLNLWADIIIRNAALWAQESARFEGMPANFLKDEIFLGTTNLIKKLIQNHSHTTGFFRPTGVVAISIPWCHSFLLAIERIVPAFLAGNSVILHLSEPSPLARMLVELVQKAEWPTGSLQILFGSRAELVPVLAGHPGINALSYVGHEKHREKVVQPSLSTGKKIQLNLSAKNSLIFLEDPPTPEDLLRQLKPCLVGQGQTAWNTQRIFILESFRESFLNKLKIALETLRPAENENSPELSLWPVVNSERIQQLKNVRERIPQEEGKVFWGGERLQEKDQNGFFVQPLFSLDLPNCSAWQQEDLRLPFFIVTSVKYSHEIAKWTNTGSYGHSAVIWGPTDKARVLGQKLHVGQVFINKWKISSAHEFTAQKSSRYGSTDYRWNGNFFSEQTLIF